jgi:hypothetical protein
MRRRAGEVGEVRARAAHALASAGRLRRDAAFWRDMSAEALRRGNAAGAADLAARYRGGVRMARWALREARAYRSGAEAVQAYAEREAAAQ